MQTKRKTPWNIEKKVQSDPQAGLEQISGRLINNFGLNSAKPQNCGRRRLNKNPAG